jgi:hypothetical protein
MGRRVFLATNAPYFVEYMERRLRYMALYSPLVVCLAVAMIPIARSDRARSAKSGVWYASLLASAIAWLWLGKIVTIDWAGTDNLTELIASAGPFGLGGGPFLYALVILMAASVALLVTATDWWTRCLAVFFAVAGIPLGWLLQRAGLERHIEKYGTVFSGTQFLLGPDRQHTLTESALFLWWVLVYGGAVTVMFVGVWLGRAFGTAIASGFRTASR